jgi:DNA-directed RNA polymerase sigma subunit (sigma70/sigma32)
MEISDCHFIKSHVSAPLERQKELDLIELFQETKDPQVAEKILRANYLFVVMYAKRYARNRTQLDDFINAGLIGFFNALFTYDSSKGMTIRGWARYSMSLEFKQCMMQNSGLMAHSKKEALAKYREVEIEDFSGLQYDRDQHFSNVDEALDLKQFLQEVFDIKITSRQQIQDVVEVLYGLELKDSGFVVHEDVQLEAVGKKFGFTKQRAYQIKKQFVDRVKNLLGDDLREYARAVGE